MNALLKSEKEIKIQHIAIDKIRPNPYQPRKIFDRALLEELSNSIKEYGVMQPINVRIINGTSYEIVAGERRLRASKLAGLSTIPAIIVDVNDKESAVIALIENLQRENLNFLEEAEGYQNLMIDYDLTQEELAFKLGKSQSTIANKLRLLKLRPEIKKLIIDNGLSERHARALLKIPDTDIQSNILFQVIDQGLTVKKTEELVEKNIEYIMKSNSKSRPRIKHYIKDIRLFTNSINQAVNLMKSSGMDIMYLIDEKDEKMEIKIQVNY